MRGSATTPRGAAPFLFFGRGRLILVQISDGAVVFEVRHGPFNQVSEEIRNGTAFQLFGGFNQALRQFVIEANRDMLRGNPLGFIIHGYSHPFHFKQFNFGSNGGKNR